MIFESLESLTYIKMSALCANLHEFRSHQQVMQFLKLSKLGIELAINKCFWRRLLSCSEISSLCPFCGLIGNKTFLSQKACWKTTKGYMLAMCKSVWDAHGVQAQRKGEIFLTKHDLINRADALHITNKPIKSESWLSEKYSSPESLPWGVENKDKTYKSTACMSTIQERNFT